MTFINELKILNENRIKVFRYVLIDDKINNILISNNIEVKEFIKTFLVLLFEDVIYKLNKDKKIENDLPFLFSFLEKNTCEKKDIFYIIKSLRNAINTFLNNKKINTYILKKSIDNIFDNIFETLIDCEVSIDEDISSAKDLSSIFEKNISFIKIDKNSKILQISKELKKEFKNIEIKKSDIFFDFLDDNIISDLKKSIVEEKSWQDEIKILNKNSEPLWFLIILEPLFNDDKNLDSFYLIFKNITLNKTLNTQKKLFLEQSKMAAMGELISMIAHQWRQPLQTISILVQKLTLTRISNGFVDNDILEKSVDDVETQLSYMSKTIDDFRNFFKPEKQKTIFRLSETVDKTLVFLHYMLTINNIDIKIEIINDLEISSYENNIIQVLINLIKNSKDALLERDSENKHIIIRVNFNENYAIIEVEDNAGGIPEKNLDKIFQSYFSTKNNENGTGLGLYMSKIIIEEHCQGKIKVKNNKDGALFTILLPLK